MQTRVIEVPEADGMPLERWTAYMYCSAICLGLTKGTFSLGTYKGKSRITLTDEGMEIVHNEQHLSECPMCGHELIHQGGCEQCINCGWSACDN